MKYKSIGTALLLLATISLIYWFVMVEGETSLYELEVRVVELNQYNSLEKANKMKGVDILLKNDNQEVLDLKSTSEGGAVVFEISAGMFLIEIAPESGYTGQKVIDVRNDERVFLIVTKANTLAMWGLAY